MCISSKTNEPYKKENSKDAFSEEASNYSIPPQKPHIFCIVFPPTTTARMIQSYRSKIIKGSTLRKALGSVAKRSLSFASSFFFL